MKILRRGLVALGIAFALPGSAFAQAWPNKPIRMIVPYTPGGYTDLMARTVGQKLSEALGQPFIFENRPGANAIIGTDVVAKANAAMNAAISDPAVAAQITKNGDMVGGGSAERLGTLTRDNYKLWGEVAKRNNIRAE